MVYIAAHAMPKTGLGVFQLLWIKLMLVLFLLWAAYLIYKLLIEIEISKGRAKWGSFIFLTSINAVMPVLVIYQYDIIYVPFMLLGLLGCVRSNTKQFLLWFSLAIIMKPLAAFAFIPLLLMQEKNIYKAAGKSIMVFLPYTFLSIFFQLTDGQAYAENADFSKSFLTNALKPTIMGQSLFIILLTLTSAYAFFLKPVSQKQRLYYGAYLCMAAYIAFFININFYYYWIVLISPFIALVISINIEKIRKNIIIDTAAGVGLMLYCGEHYNWVFSVNQIYAQKFITWVFPVTGVRPYTSLSDLIPNDISHVYTSIFIAGLIALLAVNFRCPETSGGDADIVIERDLLWWRFASALPFILGMYFCYFYTGPALG